jgi:hypothetical protein
MTLGNASHQKPGEPGRTAESVGETLLPRCAMKHARRVMEMKA